MKIVVNFTLDVPLEALPALRELAEADDSNTEAAYFIRAEAEEHVLTYLSDMGVSGVQIVKRDGRRVSE